MEKETVLITGASFGIGKELARCFAREGSNLILAARSQDKLQELAWELEREYKVRALTYTIDLADPAAAETLFDWCSQEEIHVDVLVNNAGFGLLESFAELPVATMLDIIQVNITTLTHLTRLFLPPMIERKQGGILNVASTAAYQAGPNMAVYYATKVYELHFTEALAEEVREHGIKVSCLCPGPTHTEFAARAGMESSPIFRMGPMQALDVAEIGYRGFRRGRVIVVPGWRNWLGAFAVRLVPRFFVRKVVHRLNCLQGVKSSPLNSLR
jgi:short-subunit dehydrogenase